MVWIDMNFSIRHFPFYMLFIEPLKLNHCILTWLQIQSHEKTDMSSWKTVTKILFKIGINVKVILNYIISVYIFQKEPVLPNTSNAYWFIPQHNIFNQNMYFNIKPKTGLYSSSKHTHSKFWSIIRKKSYFKDTCNTTDSALSTLKILLHSWQLT